MFSIALVPTILYSRKCFVLQPSCGAQSYGYKIKKIKKLNQLRERKRSLAKKKKKKKKKKRKKKNK